MEIGNVDKVREALANFQAVAKAKHDFIEEATDESGDYDWKAAEVVSDYDHELAYLGELLADAIEEGLS
ncbi:hypothetical protein PBI_MA5_80 [Mycobacterium phage MA5]|uniref:Uncharacterized protein n=3 Tax=Veracruzvirus TaxID=2948946 RepID=A0A023W6D1_9CAUD|nr:hypothetical protein FH39_gp16 [Mycobacterium phage Phantastic]YP_010060441.1 hypothetical protein KIP28_gp11 [Mycobacterium phage MA5]AHY27146.1 hypothetical protein PBI_PHANTASTIC_83 [Mycobacterium phage Phantastic]QGJ97358.1 hypothetical protein PBI_ISCA_78 [Mycobacterium phage Isca]QJD52129.1 hypothetical protein PBI_MA5_80 [Mycobacterium phage MA5]